MLDVRLYLLQRLTALMMIPLVLGHLVVMVYAVQGGLTAAEILSRTQGSLVWGGFYGAFVLAASIHGAIGLRAISAEVLGLRGVGLTALSWGVFLTLLLLGVRAVYAVTAGGPA
ncbi:MAG: succinate dehydrogenase [Rhodobacteraceae bacterium]|nr:succinate dehydrogenase [Paracoccaceae bacterium]